MPSKYKLTKRSDQSQYYIKTKDQNITVAWIYEHNGIWYAGGWFGEIWGEGATPMEAAKAAVKNPHIGTCPAGAAR